MDAILNPGATFQPRKRTRPGQTIAPKDDFADIPDPFGYGQRAVDFIRSLTHPLSTLLDYAFRLDPWQERIIRQIYGPRHADGTRIVKQVVLLVGRGARKTTLTAAITLLHAKGPERRQGAQLVSVAVDKKQAKGVFKEVAGMIDGDYAFTPNVGNSAKTVDQKRGAKIRDTHSRITFPGGIEYEALSSDAGSAQGRTPSLIIADEIHAWLKRDPRQLWAAMRAGAAKVANALTIVTTTAGAGQDNLAWDVIDYARKVARGDIDDPATLPILFEAPRDADWTDEALWHRVNPGMEYGYPDLATLRQLAFEAQHKPAERSDFQRYYLGIWQDHSSDPFVEMSLYDQGAEPVDLDALEDAPCWLGVDLSSNQDLTAIVAAWRDSDDGYIVHPWFFLPRENLHRKAAKDGVPYPLWAEQGFIEPTPGDVVDYRRVEQAIRDLCDRFDVREIAFDPWRAQVMMATLAEDGLPAIGMRQGAVTMVPAIAELERAIIAGRFQHGGHPVLRWNFSNIAVETDKAGNKTFAKDKSKHRIDGAQAAAMAVGRAAAGQDQRSIYDTDERPHGLHYF